MQLKIRREGNSITYIYATEKENIPLITLADGKIIIEKQCIYSAEVALSLASALKHAVLAETATLTEEEWEGLEKFWSERYERAYVRRGSSA